MITHNILDGNRLNDICERISLSFIACALMLRLFLPGLTVEVGEDALVLLFCWGALFFAMLNALQEKSYNLRNPMLTIAIVCLALVAGASAIWAGDKASTLKVVALWSGDLALFFSICYLGKKKECLSLIMSAILACMAVEVLYALYQYWIGLPGLRIWLAKNPNISHEAGVDPFSMPLLLQKIKSREVFGHFVLANSLGAYLSMYISLLVVLLITNWKNWRKVGPLAVLISLGMWALSFCNSVGSVLALFMVLALWAAYTGFKRNQGKCFLKFAILMLGISTIFACLCVYTHKCDFIGRKLGSFVMRIAYWEAGCRVFCDRPFLGVGIDNFKDHYYLYKLPWAEEVDLLHNCYLQWLVETGLVGFAALAFFIGVVTRFLWTFPQRTQPTESENSHVVSWVFPSGVFLALMILFFTGYLWEAEPLFHFLQFKMAQIFSPNVEQKFSLYIEALALPFIGGIWYAFFIYFRRWGISNTGIILSLMVFAIHSGVDMDFYIPALTQTAWLLLAILIANNSQYIVMFRLSNGIKILILLGTSCIMLWMSISLVPNFLVLSQVKRSLPIFSSQLKSILNKNTPDYREAKKIANLYRESLEKAFQIAPWDRALYEIKASLLLDKVKMQALQIKKPADMKQDLEEGIQYWNTVISFYPNWPPGYYLRAQFFFEEAKIWQRVGSQEYEKTALINAQRDIEQALRLYPVKSDFWAFIGMLAAHRGDDKATANYYHKALYMDDIGAFLWKRMSLKEREKIIEKIARIFNEQ